VAHIWAISDEANQLIKIDPARREVTGRIDVGRKPSALAATADTVWVVAYEDEALVRVDATRLEITARIPLPNSPNTLGLDHDGVWVGLQIPKPEAGLAHVDAASNEVRIYPDRGWPASRVGSEFWLYQHRGYDFVPLVAIDPATGHTVDRFVAMNISSFAVAGDSVWVSHQGDARPSYVNVISRLDLASGDREEVMAVPNAMNLIVIERDLWFSAYSDPGLLGRLDTGTRQLTSFDIPFITDMAALGAEIFMCTQPRGDKYRLPDTRLLCFDVQTGKLAARIECGVPIQEVAIA
jgi:streptogramin lyase